MHVTEIGSVVIYGREGLIGKWCEAISEWWKCLDWHTPCQNLCVHLQSVIFFVCKLYLKFFNLSIPILGNKFFLPIYMQKTKINFWDRRWFNTVLKSWHALNKNVLMTNVLKRVVCCKSLFTRCLPSMQQYAQIQHCLHNSNFLTL